MYTFFLAPSRNPANIRIKHLKKINVNPQGPEEYELKVTEGKG